MPTDWEILQRAATEGQRGFQEGRFFSPETTAWANRQPWYLPLSLPVNAINLITGGLGAAMREGQSVVNDVGNMVAPGLGRGLAGVIEATLADRMAGGVPGMVPRMTDAVPLARTLAADESGAMRAYHSSPRGAALMENPSFARWFGKSKMVDEAGNPSVV